MVDSKSSQGGATWYAPDATEHELSAMGLRSGALSAECRTTPTSNSQVRQKNPALPFRIGYPRARSVRKPSRSSTAKTRDSSSPEGDALFGSVNRTFPRASSSPVPRPLAHHPHNNSDPNSHSSQQLETQCFVLDLLRFSG
jgi:hypothetical protein